MDRTRTILVTAILCLGFGLFIPSVASLAAGRWHGPTAIETCADWCGQQFCSKCPHPVQNLCRGNQIPLARVSPYPNGAMFCIRPTGRSMNVVWASGSAETSRLCQGLSVANNMVSGSVLA